jgi:transcription elongation factor Elf1
MSTLYSPCDDCDEVATVTIEPYGAGRMATIDCPNCGVSYDTNLEEREGEE